MKEYAFAVDLGGTTVKMGLFRTSGELVDKWEIPTRKEDSGSHILPDIAAAIRSHAASNGVAMDAVEGIGIGCPGPVRKDGTVMRCVNLGWGVFNVCDALRELTGVEKIVAGNDANMATLGEQWMGGGRGYLNVVMVTLGTGVGGGAVSDGHIIYGTHGAGGEVGHICVLPSETEPCNCGRKGCLEQYASATGIARVARWRLEQDNKPSMLRKRRSISAKTVFDGAREGDALSVEIAEYVTDVLGRALSEIALVTDPGVIVIGGGVSRAGEVLREMVARHYKEHAFHAIADTEVKMAELGNDAGIYGCVRAVLNVR